MAPKTVVLSNEEWQALKSVKDSIVTVENGILSIQKTLKQVDENQAKYDAEIDQRFGVVIDALKRRRQQLKQSLNRIAQEKRVELMKQKKDLEAKHHALDQCRSAFQDLINDSTLDMAKRKMNILQTTNALLSKVNANRTYPTVTPSMFVSVPTADAVSSILDMGTVVNREGVSLSELSLKSVESYGIIFRISLSANIPENAIGVIRYIECGHNENLVGQSGNHSQVHIWRCKVRKVMNVEHFLTTFASG